MTLKRFSHFLLALTLIVSTVLTPFQPVAFAQATQAPAAAAQTAPDLQARLAAVEKAIEEKRKELHIPGVSLVIVKDDKVIYMKGLGLKDVGRSLPVTPDTLFAIGSSSKAFTAMAAAMTADDGKISLTDSPKKVLPYFKLRDPEADAKITIIDLLSHRSGLDRTDLSMVSGQLTREELIKVAGLAKPSAKLGEKFLYQNVMFAAAGEIVAKAQGTTWDDFIERRIFKPLGMKDSNTTVAETLKTKDYSLGYTYNDETKETKSVPMREIAAAAPAGSINSSARDMAQWLRLMLNGGVFEGKRLVSEKNFKELVEPHNKISDKISYGLGWFLREWEGHKVVEHGGNIDGFNAAVALMPDQKLGFALLTNISNSALAPFAMETVWSNLVGKPGADVARAEAPGDPTREVGKYLLAGAGIAFDVDMKDGNLMMAVPGQPVYKLVNIGGRRYKIDDPAAAGFYVTFRPAKDNHAETELYLEQPHGNLVLGRVKTEAKGNATAASDYNGPLKDLLGSYEVAGGPVVEVKLVEGKPSLVVPGQPPYPLVEKEKDKLASPALPDTYGATVKRDAAGKVSGLVIRQPEGEFEFTRVAEKGAGITVDELLAKMVAAAGGEENLRKHKSRVITAEMVFEHQGLTGEAVMNERAPASQATHVDLMALGKKIGWFDEYFDGAQGGEVSSFGPPEQKAGKSLEDARINADFYGVLNWKTLFKTIEIKRTTKVGDEEVYVVVKTPEKGNPVTDYVSTKSFLLLRRDTLQTSNTTQITLPVTEYYADYRLTDGLMIPHKTTTTIPTIGDIVSTIKTVKVDVDIPDTTFRAPEKK
ncbi:MAG TPA: serine hydrolase domain-containing protein [Pyrinomonadaceae bacterium]|nr:serine hydrolase domain-containing protein [Pyrinomonadaceae bacterium]